MWLKCSLCRKNCLFLTLGYFLRAPDNSHFFRFPLKVRVIGSRLYNLLNSSVCLLQERLLYHLQDLRPFSNYTQYKLSLLTPEKTHIVNNIRIGSLNLAFDFQPRGPLYPKLPYHEELLTAWLKHKPNRTRGQLRKRRPLPEQCHSLATLPNLACCRLSDSGEDAKEWGTRKVGGAGKRKSFLPFYFRVCAFSIQRTRLSKSLQQAITNQTWITANLI